MFDALMILLLAAFILVPRQFAVLCGKL